MTSIRAGNLTPDHQLIDGTWVMPSRTEPLDKYLAGTVSSVATDEIKMMEPSERAEGSAIAFGHAGIAGNGRYAVYDRAGLFSAPWIWWLMRSHGADVCLVEGWGETVSGIDESRPVEFQSDGDPRQFNAIKDDVISALGTDIQILDARPAGRFSGLSLEPRPGCRSGHIPGSSNIPFGQLKFGRSFLPEADLRTLFNKADVDFERPIITTCGSGVTASGLAFALIRCGAQSVRVYQGSWAEWGVDPELPIETGS